MHLEERIVDRFMQAAVPTIFPKLHAIVDKTLKGTIKLYQGIGAAEEGSKKIDDALRSIGSMYGGGFYSGQPTEIDQTMTALHEAMRDFETALKVANGHASTIMKLLKQLRDQFATKDQ